MKIIYRISDNRQYIKEKPDYINNENCLKNATEVFKDAEWLVIADNVSKETLNMLMKYVPKNNIVYVQVGNGARTFNIALDIALRYDDNEIIYFLEDDYLHKDGSQQILEEGFDLNFSFISLYDHPDKYITNSVNGTHYRIGTEDTILHTSKTVHWKNSSWTTMTFACKVSTLKRTEQIIRSFTSTDHPFDIDMFLELKKHNELLIVPIPGMSTHGETSFLDPLTDWGKLI